MSGTMSDENSPVLMVWLSAIAANAIITATLAVSTYLKRREIMGLSYPPHHTIHRSHLSTPHQLVWVCKTLTILEMLPCYAPFNDNEL